MGRPPLFGDMGDPDADVDPDSEADSDSEADPDSQADPDDGVSDRDSAESDPVAALSALEGWRAEGFAARVHYRGADRNYSVEYYRPTDRVLYWRVGDDGETAVPVARDGVPDPLRERVRRDLAEAGVDPEIESRSV